MLIEMTAHNARNLKKAMFYIQVVVDQKQKRDVQLAEVVRNQRFAKCLLLMLTRLTPGAQFEPPRCSTLRQFRVSS